MMANLHQISSLRHSQTRNSSSKSKNEKISPIARENNYKWVYSPLQKKIREKMREKDSTQPVHKPLAAKNDLLCIPISYLLLSCKFFESRRPHDTKSCRKKNAQDPQSDHHGDVTFSVVHRRQEQTRSGALSRGCTRNKLHVTTGLVLQELGHRTVVEDHAAEKNGVLSATWINIMHDDDDDGRQRWRQDAACCLLLVGLF